MGLSGFISSQLKTLNQPLAANSAAHPDDVFGVKTRLYEDGSLMVRKALNATATRDQVPLDLGTGRMGPTTLERLQNTLKEPQKAKIFYDALANERTKQYPHETPRFDYFRLNQ